MVHEESALSPKPVASHSSKIQKRRLHPRCLRRRLECVQAPALCRSARSRRIYKRFEIKMNSVSFLLVDDLEENLLSLEALLRRDNLVLLTARSGDERTRRIPIIFVTAGSADTQHRFRGYEAGAVDFIQKPIETDVLRSKADVFFELYRQRQQIAAQRDELERQ